MKYQNCIFDLYGTLADIHTEENSPQLWAHMADEYRRQGAPWQPEELQAAYLRLVGELEGGASSAGDTHEAHPEIQIEQVFQALYREKGVDAGMELAVQTGLEFRRQSTQYIRLYDGAAELLRALRASGRGVWLLSNAQAIFTRWELDQLGLTPLFDGIYLSSDYGCKKPDPRFFQTLLRERAIPAETAVMVGNDGACDIRGAQTVGLSTVYIRSNISPKEPLPQADHVLETMDLNRVKAILMEA
ncbi:MAG: HAD family hydrolase [Oscillospiraceae bacterium]|nr:HAD family hydrolase [Oscillospiraceae bacterium]